MKEAAGERWKDAISLDMAAQFFYFVAVISWGMV